MTLKNDGAKSIRPLASLSTEAFQLGEAQIKPTLNRIEKEGAVHQVEPKVMQALIVLCARPGHVVPRDELLERVWGQVADDYLLNRAISELRRIFGDRAQNPTYIETIRKTGYRVIAPIKPVASASLVASSHTNLKDPSSQNALQQSISFAQIAALINRRKLIIAVAVMVGLGFITLLWKHHTLSRPDGFEMSGYQVYPATSATGREYQPALSPDGSRLAYVSDNQSRSTVFVKMIHGQKHIALSTGDSSPQYPKWTSDGQQIIYANINAPVMQFKSVSPLGGAQRTLHTERQVFGLRGMNLSPNDEQILYAKRPSINAPYQIWMLTLASGEQRQLTFPEQGSLGDIDPLFSPDGNTLFFVRGRDEVSKDIYTLDISSNHLTQLTFDNRKINGITWSPDGTRLLFTSTRSGLYRLWSIKSTGGEPKPTALGLETVQRPTTALGIDAVVFEDWKHSAKLVEIHLTDPRKFESLTQSTRWDSSPSFSSNGKMVVFVSNRQGPFAIWLSDLELGETYEWISMGGAFIDNPSWSPDDSKVIFDANEDGKTQLYWIDRDSTLPKKLALGPGDNRAATWSMDGKWVYFESNRYGVWQLFAWQVGSDNVQKLNLAGGKNPQESVDGNWILFTSENEDGLWRCAKTNCMATSKRSGAERSKEKTAELLIADVQRQDAANWTASSKGIYFINRAEETLSEIAFYSYATEEIEKIMTLPDYTAGWGMVISPDESRLILTQLKQLDSDIKIAKP